MGQHKSNKVHTLHANQTNSSKSLLKSKLPGILMAAHGQSGHLEETDEEAKHQGSEDSSLPADPIHSSGYGQTIQVRMSTTSKSNIKIKA